jgi:WD40 repeat protein
MKTIQLALTIACLSLLALSPVQATDKIDFDSDVAPILTMHCAGCHNEDDSESDFDVSSVEQILKGSSAGPALIAEEGSASHIIQLMKGTKEPAMPPIEEYDRVPDEEIAIIEQWINEGAKPSPAADDSVDENPNVDGAGIAERAMKPESIKIEAPKLEPGIQTQPAILSAAFSDDGKQIAVARYGVVQLVDAATLKTQHEFDSLPGKVNSVQFSSDGKLLLGASGIAGVGGRAYLWDVASKKLLQRFDGHSDVMYDATISDDGKLVATSAYDKKVLMWDVISGKQLRALKGHNAAIYDLDFSPDSKNLVSASGDQTLKVWHVASGQRLDTLGQPLKEQFVAAFSPDGTQIVGGGRDNRFRVWQLESVDSPSVNPIVFAGFAHEASIVRLEFSRDGSRLFSSAEDRKVKIWDAKTFAQIGMLELQPEVCTALAISPKGESIFLGRLDGTMEIVAVPEEKRAVDSVAAVQASESYLNKPPVASLTREVEPNGSPEVAQRAFVPCRIAGIITKTNGEPDADLFRFDGVAGEALMIETRAEQDKSPLDTRIEILYPDGTPVPQVVLRAVRDSYLTFRGRNSDDLDNFRLHNWQEMQLNQYLYANGEVSKLFLHPRGPDSGFRVYPGTGKRFAYFGTTAISHPLQEPCYIVEAYPPGSRFVPNGLPVFELNYENDDDSRREIGNDSRLKFVPPKDGTYLVRVTDVRGFGGDDYKYELTVRRSNPDFAIEVKSEKKIKANSGQYFTVKAKRRDGFEGSIRVDIENVPAGYRVSAPLTIEAGHIEAVGTIFADASAKTITKEQAAAITLRSSSVISGKKVVEVSHGFGEMELETGEPKIEIHIVRNESDPLPKSIDLDRPLVFEIRPGESIEAFVVAKRNDHTGRISFGNEGSGRNLPHGVYIDDIGLNGLMITEGNLRQRFFIKAEPFVQPQERIFFLRCNDVEGIATPPVILKVLPTKDNRLTDR